MDRPLQIASQAAEQPIAAWGKFNGLGSAKIGVDTPVAQGIGASIPHHPSNRIDLHDGVPSHHTDALLRERPSALRWVERRLKQKRSHGREFGGPTKIGSLLSGMTFKNRIQAQDNPTVKQKLVVSKAMRHVMRIPNLTFSPNR